MIVASPRETECNVPHFSCERGAIEETSIHDGASGPDVGTGLGLVEDFGQGVSVDGLQGVLTTSALSALSPRSLQYWDL
jgi:hypothetical protein